MSFGKITERSVIYTGNACNINCNFCYYDFCDKKKNCEYAKIRNSIENVSKSIKSKNIDITGGEPTIHPQILDIIELSCKNNLIPRIITNGIRLENYEFCTKLHQAGVKDFLFSFHGTATIHDKMVGRNGAYKSLTNGIRNIKSIGFSFASNTVITKCNFQILPEIANILISLGATNCNFIMFNPFESWNDDYIERITISNEAAAPYIIRALDVCKNKKVEAVIRYFPFCILKGHEEFICNFAQLSYDFNEWDFKSWIKGEFPLSEKDYYSIALMLNRTYYKMDANCRICGAKLICGGIKRNLLELNSKSTKPYNVRSIVDPLYFRRYGTDK